MVPPGSQGLEASIRVAISNYTQKWLKKKLVLRKDVSLMATNRNKFFRQAYMNRARRALLLPRSECGQGNFCFLDAKDESTSIATATTGNSALLPASKLVADHIQDTRGSKKRSRTAREPEEGSRAGASSGDPKREMCGKPPR